MKKIIALVLTIAMFASLAVLCSSAAEKIGDSTTTWEVSNGVLTISGTGATPDYTNDNYTSRPWESQVDNITKVVVTSGVTTIGTRTFTKMNSMKELVFGADVKVINMDSFSYCEGLETVTFEGKVETIGQGIVFGTNNIKTVNLPAGWTKEAFKAVATQAPYNFESNGGYATGFDTAAFSIGGGELIKPVEPKETDITISPLYGKVENWSGGTFFIAGIKFSDNDKLFDNLKSGKWTADFIIKDETTKTAKQITKYAFDDAGKEFYASSFLRIAVCNYGINPVDGHSYTVIMNVYQGSKCVASGSSEVGAFDAFNPDFKTNGPIVPETVPHTSKDVSYDTKPATPVAVAPTADASVYMVVVAAVAMLGMAVVVTKKVHA